MVDFNRISTILRFHFFSPKKFKKTNKIFSIKLDFTNLLEGNKYSTLDSVNYIEGINGVKEAIEIEFTNIKVPIFLEILSNEKNKKNEKSKNEDYEWVYSKPSPFMRISDKLPLKYYLTKYSDINKLPLTITEKIKKTLNPK